MKRDRSKNLVQHAAELAGLPKTAAPNVPYIDMICGSGLVLHDHKGVLECGENVVSVSCGSMIVRITGSKLVIRVLTKKDIAVDGLIKGVEFV